VIAFMLENHLLPFYIPARCTDNMQVGDTVCNYPFKAGMKAGFLSYIHQEYETYKESKPEDVAIEDWCSIWNPNLNPGYMKQSIVNFVVIGMNRLKTPEMKDTIKEAFAR
jgi:hypothetical protein